MSSYDPFNRPPSGGGGGGHGHDDVDDAENDDGEVEWKGKGAKAGTKVAERRVAQENERRSDKFTVHQERMH